MEILVRNKIAEWKLVGKKKKKKKNRQRYL